MEKNYMTNEELRSHCEKLGLSSDGQKWELLKRIKKFKPSRAKSISPLPKINQATQTSTETIPPKIIKSKFGFMKFIRGDFLKVLLLIVLVFVCHFIFHLFMKDEITVYRRTRVGKV